MYHRELSTSAQKGFGYFLLVLVILAAIYVAFVCYRWCRRHRDFQEMEMKRAQADDVLGDMGGVDDSDFEEDYEEGKDDGALRDYNDDDEGNDII